MIQQVLFPSPPLKSIVYRYDFFSFDKDHSAEAVYFYPPSFDNGFLFIFYNDLPILIKNERLDNTPMPSTHFSPTLRTPSFNLRFNNLRAIRVTFIPGAISSLFNISLHAFPNIILELGETLDKELSFLHEQLAETGTPQEQIFLIEQYLLRQLRMGGKQDNRLFNGLNGYLFKNGYTTSIKGLARELGYSLRSFNRHLNVKLGISASEFIRIHRINLALKYLQQSTVPSLTQLANKIDYYDQSHFIRDFRRMTYQTPREYLKSIGKAREMPSNSAEDYFEEGLKP